MRFSMSITFILIYLIIVLLFISFIVVGIANDNWYKIYIKNKK